jgi:hypothetical protein
MSEYNTYLVHILYVIYNGNKNASSISDTEQSAVIKKLLDSAFHTFHMSVGYSNIYTQDLSSIKLVHKV